MAECAFCGQDKKLTDEHVWPDWLIAAIPATQPRNARLLGRIEPGGEFRADVRDEGPASVPSVVKVVCQEECNGGWMSRLEKEIKPLILPMILGQACELNPDAQRLIVLWTAKTMMMVEYTDHRTRATSPAQRHYLYKRRKAPPLTTVWIGKFDNGQAAERAYYHRGLGLERRWPGGVVDSPVHVNVQLTTFTIGHLALVILSADLPGTIYLPLSFGVYGRSLHRITATRPLRWPAGPSLDDGAVGLVREAMLGGFGQPTDISRLGTRPLNPRRD